MRLLPIVAALCSVVCAGMWADAAAPYKIDGDSIDAPLADVTGDATRGRAIVGDRSRGLCLLCHAGPFPDQHMHGDLGPDLRGAGSRWSAGQLRARLIDNSSINPETIMPSFYRTDGFARIGNAWKNKSVLSAQEIEDVVAFLVTLKEQ